MKINRLLEITLILLNKGTVTARELADRFDVSTRTIFRDIDVLSTAGVPVYTNKGRGGGVSLLEEFAISKVMLTPHEKDSLLLALKTLQAARYPEIDSFLDKIGAVFKNTGSTDWISIEFSSWGADPDEEYKLRDIKQAVLESRLVAFDYINAQGIKSRRSLEPMYLLFRDRYWYIWGYCLAREDFRMFRISRIRNMELTNSRFVRRPLPEIRKDQSSDYQIKLVTLDLRFQPEALHRLYDEFADDQIVRNADGTFSVTVTYPEDEWVYGRILSFGPYVEVLGPEHIRTIVREKMQKALRYYQK
jgi:predicted DNA-binding transcriptional regulator YafY